MTRNQAIEKATKLAQESNARKSRDQIQRDHKELNNLFKAFNLTWNELV